MGLIEDLNTGKYNLVLISILFVFMFHQYWNKTSEPMADTQSTDQIKDAIKQVYAADVDAIRNLSNVATQLQKDGLTVPGHMNIKGKMNVSSDTNAKDFPDWLSMSVEHAGDSHIRLKTKADNNKNIYLINRDGHFRLNTEGPGGGDMFKVNKNGIIATNGLDPTDLPAGWGGGIRTIDIFASGTIACGKDKKINASMNSDGIMACTTVNVASDYRIKDNVTEVSSNDNFNKLRPVTYFNKINNKNEIGFIAHEVQELFPELVTGEKDGETNQSVNYIGLIPLLVNEIKELKLKIKQLEEK